MNKSLVITAMVILIVGVSGGYWFANSHLKLDIQDHGQIVSTPKTREPLFYRNPMNPTVTSPVPAKDSMGMDYIPIYADDDHPVDEPAGTVRIDPNTVQNMGVRTAVVKKDILSHVVRTVGRVAYDEERIVRLHPKVEGWIETLRVDKTGEKVKKNQDLLSIYSPQLVVSQQEYILALNNLKGLEKSPIEDIRRGAEDLVSSSLERLKLLDVPKHQIHDLLLTTTSTKACTFTVQHPASWSILVHVKASMLHRPLKFT